MTAFGDDDARARTKLLGVVLLDKPFPLGVMPSAVRALLAQTSVDDELTAHSLR